MRSGTSRWNWKKLNLMKTVRIVRWIWSEGQCKLMQHCDEGGDQWKDNGSYWAPQTYLVPWFWTACNSLMCSVEYGDSKL